VLTKIPRFSNSEKNVKNSNVKKLSKRMSNRFGKRELEKESRKNLKNIETNASNSDKGSKNTRQLVLDLTSCLGRETYYLLKIL